MNTAWLIPAKNTKKRITITTTDITKITKKKVTEKDHIDHDVFEDEEVILQACEDSFMIQIFRRDSWQANYKLNIHRTDVFHVNVKVNYSTVTHLWIKASNNNSPPTTLHLRQNFLKLWITILWSQV